MQPDQRRTVLAGLNVIDAELLQVLQSLGGKIRPPCATRLFGIEVEQSGSLSVVSCWSSRKPERYGVGVGEQDLLVHEAVRVVQSRSIKRPRRPAADKEEAGISLGRGYQRRPRLVPQLCPGLNVGVPHVQRPELEGPDA